MQVPVEIVFKHLEHSDAIEQRALEESVKLEQFYDRITSCRVVIERPQRRRHKGDLYVVRIVLAIPGAGDVVVNRDAGLDHAHEDVFVAIRDSFKAARRQLQDLASKRQGHVKHHDEPPRGRIASLFPDTGHGFIASADGRQVYFHRNSVEGNQFDALKPGQTVSFSEDRGDKGPQATFVKIIGDTGID